MPRATFRSLHLSFQYWRRRMGATGAPPPALDPPVAILGDVHGRDDLLEALLDQLARHPHAGTMRLVQVGDLVDRGPATAQVLARMRALCARPAPFAQCCVLMGNHERMALDFLADPAGMGPRWMAAGGEASLASFGLTLPHSRKAGQDSAALWQSLRDDLVQAMGPDLLDWLQALPLSWQIEDLFITHAGADPIRPLQAQPEASLLWGKGAGGPRRDGIWVAQGHLIQPEPRIGAGRILVDTGAYRTGCLSAVILGPEGPTILHARDAD